MALVDASISLGGGVDLHLRLDAMLPTPELADLISEQVIIEQWRGGGATSLLRWYLLEVKLPKDTEICSRANIGGRTAPCRPCTTQYWALAFPGK